MKCALIITCTILITYCNAQISNSDFKDWEIVFGDEQPVNWHCNGLSFGACRKFSLDNTNFAVKMDNSLPCVDSATNEAKSLGNGWLSQTFTAPSSKFTLSYDLAIDTIDLPASFIVSLYKDGIGNFLEVEHNEIFSGNVKHDLDISTDFGLDNIQVTIKPVGYKKENGEHDCDKGYIAATIDNVQALMTVSTSNISTSKIKIYPNPSDGMVHIQSPVQNIKRVEVYDLLGRNVLTQSVKDLHYVTLDLTTKGELLMVKIIDKNGNRWLEKVSIYN